MYILLITESIDFLKQMDELCQVDFLDPRKNNISSIEKKYNLVIIDYKYYNQDYISSVKKSNNDCTIWVYATLENIKQGSLKHDIILNPSSSVYINQKLILLKSQEESNEKSTHNPLGNYFSYLLTKCFLNKEYEQSVISCWHVMNLFLKTYYNINDYFDLYCSLIGDCEVILNFDLFFNENEHIIVLIILLIEPRKKIEVNRDEIIVYELIENKLLLDILKHYVTSISEDNGATKLFFT